MKLMNKTLSLLFLFMILVASEASAQTAEDRQMEAEVKRQVEQRIRSYMDHLAKEIAREEARNEARSQAIQNHFVQQEKQDEIRRNYLKSLPPPEKAGEERAQLRAQHEAQKQKKDEKRRQVTERYTRKTQLLQEAQEKYDILDPALEYGLSTP